MIYCYNEYLLAGIVHHTGVADVIEQPAVLNMKDGLLERSVSLFNKLMILFEIPVKDFHDREANISLCLLSSALTC